MRGDLKLGAEAKVGPTHGIESPVSSPVQPSLPQHVLDVLKALTEQAETLEVWLIGSRANNTAGPDSDWDLLVFSSAEPTPIATRQPGVDVIHVGPSGQFLLEGQLEVMTRPFASFVWRPSENETATYTALRLIDFAPGVELNRNRTTLSKQGSPCRGSLEEAKCSSQNNRTNSPGAQPLRRSAPSGPTGRKIGAQGRASAFGLSPGLGSPDPLGRTRK